MTLNLNQLLPQVHAMAREVGQHAGKQQQLIERANALMQEWHERFAELREIGQGVASEQTFSPVERWRVAEPLEPLCTTYPAPAPLNSYTVLATDGSSIELDRHEYTACNLINIGHAVLHYGPDAFARLGATPTLYYRDEDLYLTSGSLRVPIQGALLDLMRSLAEQQSLLDLAQAWSSRPTIAMSDGTLLLWDLSRRATEEEAVARAVARFGAGLSAFQELDVPLCGYISRPNGREVVNLLRLAACPRGSQETQSHTCPRCRGGECLREALQPLADRLLMTHLRPGERSARFASQSPVLRQYGYGVGVQLCYLHVGAEIVRLEVPSWVGEDPVALDLVHAVALESAQRGRGYPPALLEAHEQAVIRASDRAAFTALVASALHLQQQHVALSMKQLSKVRRAV